MLKIQKKSAPENCMESDRFKSKSPMGIQCYICGKTFGAHSIKIHEKQCLKKWHSINDPLPKDIRPPEPSRQEYSCINEDPHNAKTQKESTKPITSQTSNTASSDRKSPLFACYLCGKLFSVHTIYKHEPECLKIWRVENDKLPEHKRKREPQKQDIKFTPSGGVDFAGTFNRIWENHLNELVPCRICGRTFAPNRIEIHENVCKGDGIKRKNIGQSKSKKP